MMGVPYEEYRYIFNFWEKSILKVTLLLCTLPQNILKNKFHFIPRPPGHGTRLAG